MTVAPGAIVVVDKVSLVPAGLSVIATTLFPYTTLFRTVPENVIGCPGPEAFTHALLTVIAGAVSILQVALLFALTDPRLMASTPLPVTVSVLSQPVWVGT